MAINPQWVTRFYSANLQISGAPVFPKTGGSVSPEKAETFRLVFEFCPCKFLESFLFVLKCFFTGRI